MVPPALVLTMRLLLNPPLKLILPKPPGAAHFKSRELAFAGQAGDGEGVELQNPGQFVRGEQFHARVSSG